MKSTQRILLVANHPRRASEDNVWLIRLLPWLKQLGFDPEVLFFYEQEGLGYAGEALRKAGIVCHFRKTLNPEQDINEVIALAKSRKPSIFIPYAHTDAYLCTPWMREMGVIVVAFLATGDHLNEKVFQQHLTICDPFQVSAAIGASSYWQSRFESSGLPAIICPRGVPIPPQKAAFSSSPYRIIVAGMPAIEHDYARLWFAAIVELLITEPLIEIALLGKKSTLPTMPDLPDAESLESRLYWLDSVAPSQIQEKFSRYQSFLLLGDNTVPPPIMIEAMSVGLVPLLDALPSGFDTIINHDENGVLLEAPDELILTVQSLINDPLRWQTLSDAAANMIHEHFNDEICAHAWADFMHNLIPAKETNDDAPPPVDETTIDSRFWQLYQRVLTAGKTSTIETPGKSKIIATESTAADVTPTLPTTPDTSAPRYTEEDLNAMLEKTHTAAEALKLARAGNAIDAGAFAFVAYRTAAMTDRNCAVAYEAMGLCLHRLSQLEDAYLCLKEASRVGTLNDASRQLLLQLESDPQLISAPLRVYRERIGIDGFEQTTTPRRILIFVQASNPITMLPGEEAFLPLLPEMLRARGHQVSWLAASADMPLSNAGADELLLTEIERFQPDVCLTGNWGGAIHQLMDTVLAKNIPLIHWLEGPDPGYAPDRTPRSPLYCLAGCSSWVNHTLFAAGYRAPHDAVLPPGTGLQKYYRLMLPRTEKLRLCYVGRMIGEKGPHLILNALGLLQKLQVPFTCEFVGDFEDPRYQSHFLAMLKNKDLDNCVQINGYCDADGLAALFARSNVYIMPSICDEPFGLHQIKAQAAGLAVIRSATGGHSDLLTNQVNGLLFKTADAEDLARQLYILNEDQNLWQSIALQGQADAFRYSSATAIVNFEAVISAMTEL
jgi:glycosyltransferase involved in cell wall biosynthesis